MGPGEQTISTSSRLRVEADEAWRFVGNKANPQWLWLALEVQGRQVIAFQVGDRSRKSARKRWQKIPAVYRQQATFYTDGYASYHGVIPSAQHHVITKTARTTNHVERLNCTLRQRVSRLVRATLSFSKKLDNHIGAIKYFYVSTILKLEQPYLYNTTAYQPHAGVN